MSEKRKINPIIKRAVLILCVALLAVTLVFFDIPKGLKAIVFGNPNIPKAFGRSESLDIAFFDVGQGDSALIGCNGKYVLIDAGENDQGNILLRYIDKLKVKKIDVMILTHPHSDHIGGADVIIENIDVGKVYMPDVVSPTLSFESVIDAMGEKDIAIKIPNVSDVLDMQGMIITFLHPPHSKEFENMNDVSIVVKVQNSFGSALFTGDAESAAENDILASGADITADVLKAGHHGSSTSTSFEFLNAVSPSYAIISCGEYNDFGHPHEEVMDLLGDANVRSFITHEKGNIYISFSEEGTHITTER